MLESPTYDRKRGTSMSTHNSDRATLQKKQRKKKKETETKPREFFRNCPQTSPLRIRQWNHIFHASYANI